MQRFTITCGLLATFAAFTATTKAENENGWSAEVSRPVYPVLIRNDYGLVLRVEISAEEEIQAKSFEFTLEGTNDLQDVTRFSLFYTGSSTNFSSAKAFGKPHTPAKQVTFEGAQRLAEGHHVFWLACTVAAAADLTHHVAAQCLSIGTSQGSQRPKDSHPNRSSRIGVALRKHNDDGVHTYRIPALTTTTKGTLLAVYDMRRRKGRDLQEDIDIGLSRSTDGGQTWEPVQVIMDMGEYGGLPQALNGCSDPGLIVDHETGDIFCFAVWMHGKEGKHQWSGDGSEPGYEIGKSAQFLMVKSQDDGQTWSQPENLTRQLKQEAWWLFAPAPQQGIQLPDGTLVMPSQGRDESGREFSTIMSSQDHGKTWTVGSPAYKGGSECQAVHFSDGTIMLNMRNERERFRAVYITRDLGKSWQPHSTNRNTLIEPNCNGSLLRLKMPDGSPHQDVLLFANPHTQKGRTHHTIQVSLDRGETWPERYRHLLDEGLGAGYPSLTQVDDQHIGIVYEGSQSHVVFQKFTIRELLE